MAKAIIALDPIEDFATGQGITATFVYLDDQGKRRADSISVTKAQLASQTAALMNTAARNRAIAIYQTLNSVTIVATDVVVQNGFS